MNTAFPSLSTARAVAPPAPGPVPPAIRFDGAGRSYRDGTGVHDALRHVSVSLPEASFTAVMGPSGSGKTTLLNLAAGLDTPTRGRVLVGGHDLGALGPDDRTCFRRDHIGMVFQAYNLVEHLTVEENIALPVTLAGRRPDAGWLTALTGMVGLGGLEGRRPGELSGGQAQRVALARALFTRPTVVLADEPTGALDARTADRVLTLLRTTARELRQTVVVVTHDARVAATADRVLFISDGDLVDHLDAPTTDTVAARFAEVTR